MIECSFFLLYIISYSLSFFCLFIGDNDLRVKNSSALVKLRQLQSLTMDIDLDVRILENLHSLCSSSITAPVRRPRGRPRKIPLVSSFDQLTGVRHRQLEFTHNQIKDNMKKLQNSLNELLAPLPPLSCAHFTENSSVCLG